MCVVFIHTLLWCECADLYGRRDSLGIPWLLEKNGPRCQNLLCRVVVQTDQRVREIEQEQKKYVGDACVHVDGYSGEIKNTFECYECVHVPRCV